jgi:hypothetical protein
MVRKNPETSVRMAFEEVGQRIPIANIQPLRMVAANVKKTPKYAQIAASIREVGIIEPPIVARDRSESGKFLLLDGHLRIEILKEMGETEVACLISTELRNRLRRQGGGRTDPPGHPPTEVQGDHQRTDLWRSGIHPR